MNHFRRFLFSGILAALFMVLMLFLANSASARSIPTAADSSPLSANLALTGQFLTGPNAGEPLDIALAYLEANRESLGLTAADLVGLESESYVTQKSGITHIQLWQTHDGIRVYNGMILINTAADGSVINLHNHFVSNLAKSISSDSVNLSAEEAILAAAAHLGLAVKQDLFTREVTGGPAQAALYNDGGISRQDIPVRLIYMPTRQGVHLAWDVEVYELTSDDWWSLRVDAAGGALLDRHNYTIHEDFLAQAEEAHGQLPEAAAEPVLPGPLSGPTNPQYLVYAWPVESPNYAVPAPPADARTLEVNPHLDASALGSPFGWHATGATSWTNTQGNNVDARKSSTIRHDCGVDLDCSPALDLTVDPTVGENVDSGIVNLFYWNNIIHDVWYNYGFDEPARNFQDDNNGQGGAGGDRVLANAQAPGNCNANMSTPGDGSNPTMNMFICDLTTPSRDGDLDNGVIIHEYTHGISNRLTGGASVSCLNNSEQMGEGWSDWYGLIMTVEPGDAGSDSRGIGTWLLGQGPDGVGVRQFPYSTDMGVNPHTYSDISTVAVPHGVGSIWSAMLWEVTWNFIDEYGFDPDIYNGSSGNNMIMQLVTDGMKLQPCSPGFVDGRDAILAADQALYGGANQCLIWEGFAKRGLGFSADQGTSGSTGDGTEAFDLPPACEFLGATPETVDICQGDTADFTVQVGAAYVAPVTLEAAGHPGDAAFSPNPVDPVPGTSTLSISNTGGAAGPYTVTITGTGATLTQAITTIDMNVFDAVPAAATLTAPADGAADVGLRPTFEWTAAAGATGYLLEVDDDPAFGSIDYSANVAGTSHMAAGNLGSLTTYYWRVTADNPCGSGAASNVFSFTTANLICSTPELSIPDDSPGGASDSMVISDNAQVTDIDVAINTSHTWVGDLDFTITHVDSGISVTIIDRPGTTGGGFGCSADDIGATLDDEGSDGPVENQCDPSPPALFGQPTPNNPLSAFDGLNINGEWELTVVDNAGGDLGTVHEWCLIAATDLLQPSLIMTKTVGLDRHDCAMSDSLSIPSGNTEVTYCYQLHNDGNMDLSYHTIEDTQLGIILGPDYESPVSPGETVWLTATAMITQSTVATGTWTINDSGGAFLFSGSDVTSVNIGAPTSVGLSSVSGPVEPALLPLALAAAIILLLAVVYGHRRMNG